MMQVRLPVLPIENKNLDFGGQYPRKTTTFKNGKKIRQFDLSDFHNLFKKLWA